MSEQPELFEVPTTWTPWRDRLPSSPQERVYLEEWARLNTERGRPLFYLEALMRSAVTRRDAVVAASFAQWLGTNCGLSYILTCESRNGRERQVADLLFHWRRPGGDVHPSFKEQAEHLAGPARLTLSEGAHGAMVKEIADALEAAARHGRPFAAGSSAEPAPRAITLRVEP